MGAASLAIFVSCKKRRRDFACADTSGLTPDDRGARTALGYVEPAPDLARTCDTCRQFVAAADEESCGTCQVLKGPVHPRGTCKGFAAKSA